MSSLIELTASVVSAHVSNKHMSSDEMLLELQKVYASLKALESGTAPVESSAPERPELTVKQAFKKDEVVCMVCGRGGFKTLRKHLTVSHDLKPAQYRKQFNIPSTQSLAAKSYSESRRQMAIDRNLGDGLAKAREARAAGKKAIPAVKANAKTVPAVRAKAPLPMKTSKAPVPAVKVKAGLPAVQKKAAVPAKIEKKPAAPKSTRVKK